MTSTPAMIKIRAGATELLTALAGQAIDGWLAADLVQSPDPAFVLVELPVDDEGEPVRLLIPVGDVALIATGRPDRLLGFAPGTRRSP